MKTEVLSPYDLHLFSQGVHYELYRHLGAHPMENGATHFSVWAPNATAVFVAGDFNHWNCESLPMQRLDGPGVWALEVPEAKKGHAYKFVVWGKDGLQRWKADPFAFAAEVRPKTASVIWGEPQFRWTDDEWMDKRNSTWPPAGPLNIYEVHLGSWRRGEFGELNYRDLAKPLAEYVLGMGFTHVEFMPIMEYPLDESWGYQVTGFFSVTSRYGTAEDFQYLVNHLHNQGIGVFLDWVPAHFPTDDWALERFDGTDLFEHPSDERSLHPHWGTLEFNLGRREVRNFLIASAHYFLDCMHVDGLRVDAVSSMLYLDYGRQEGEWRANVEGGNINLDAMEFFRHLNSSIHKRFHGAVMMAEESTAFPQVSHHRDGSGLGFDMKWNMGWMNDSLSYFSKDPIYRSYHQDLLTFGQMYAYSENFILPFSHDEVVHEKGSLLRKMPGDDWQKFANLRLLLSYQACMPGKNLLFMGAEMGMWDEWNPSQELQWSLLQFPSHLGLQTMVRELNFLVLHNPALFERDFQQDGFSWVDHADSNNQIICYRRFSQNQALLCIHNFSPQSLEDYKLPCPGDKGYIKIFNTDDSRYGGSGIDGTLKKREGAFTFQIPPLATMIFLEEGL